eukprot:CAMPEP_0169409610 /NCGR_PEP_ID=MMETSP1017-20121227/59338_1 /TAXON_ID=342587 /ORGANISM="Karlodinium micrum, Strain CCMP2283" /LENGTH=73 /DNA_ID=CAMNT_0009516817 /DNA_START=81 /DNA_END=302 /DNA_ORIENTATION=-
MSVRHFPLGIATQSLLRHSIQQAQGSLELRGASAGYLRLRQPPLPHLAASPGAPAEAYSVFDEVQDVLDPRHV